MTTDRAERRPRIKAFLAANGWAGVDPSPLAGDASFRRYERLNDGERRAVLMDAPPPQEDIRPFVAMARHLLGLGLSAPRVLAEDAEAGLLLLEDLGDDTYTRLLAQGVDERDLYELATDVLIHIHRQPPGRACPERLPPYDTQRLLDEACLLTDWYMPAVFGHATAPEARHAYVAAWRKLFLGVHAQPTTLVLRDYHVDNLMRLPARDGVTACGLLDFQDAVAGPAAYDLMSLLEDARRDIDPGLVEAMLARYYAAFPRLDREEFETVFAIVGAQRHAKVVGIFTRLCARDGKPDYLVHIPRVWRLLERSTRHPTLAPVARWLDRHIPRDKRGIPPCPATPR